MPTKYRLEITERIPAKEVRSLLWQRDELTDWVDIGRMYRLDGGVRYAYRFDSVIGSQSGYRGIAPTAYDAANRRLAIFQKDEIVVISAIQ